ncbi:MAG: HNH endonuclease, partial [Psychrosphaera sp.]|nr:HNH endonuclease [Psychrosphaera sp.]
MSRRPDIPTAIKRKVKRQAGHQCSVCGYANANDIAHIVDWCQTQDHSYDNLVYLCCNCHRRADGQSWDKLTLAFYKQNPWVLRSNKYNQSIIDKTIVDFGQQLESGQYSVSIILGQI